MSENTTSFRQTVATLRDNYPKAVLDSLMNILGTHDTARILTAMGGIHAYTKDEMSRIRMDAATRKKLAIAATGIWHVPTITQKSIADNEKICYTIKVNCMVMLCEGSYEQNETRLNGGYALLFALPGYRGFRV